MQTVLTRRAFLGTLGVSAATMILAACSGVSPPLTPTVATNTAASPASTPNAGGVSTTVSSVIALATNVANRGNATPGAGRAGAVYALTNQESTNAVAVFNRAADGKLTMIGLTPTGGKGVGDQQDTEGLGSQGALALSPDGKLLFACNGGSGDISILAVQDNGLSYVDKVASNGPRPISLTIHGDVLYVLNYDRQRPGKGNITAFTMSRSNSLVPLANSTKALSSTGNVDPGQVLFSPKGDLLAVTEKATNKIVTYSVGSNGVAGPPSAQASGGEAPFSLVFANDGLLLTADNFGDAEGKGAASSFAVGEKGSLKLVSKAVPAKLTGACWIVATADGKYAYVANTGSAVISAYTIDSSGKIALLNADGITARAGKKPRDLALSSDNRFLYALDSVSGTVEAFALQAGGGLESLGAVGTFPAPGANGLIAR